MGKLIKNNKKIIFLLAILGILIGSSVFALQGDYPPSPFGTKLTDNSTIGDLVMYIYQWGITLGGLALFIVLVVAGFQYLASAGSPTAMKSAKDRITSAGIGIAVLLGSYLILNTINPQLTSFPSGEIEVLPEPVSGEEPEPLPSATPTSCDEGVTVTIEGEETLPPLYPTETARCHSFSEADKIPPGKHIDFDGDPDGCTSNLYFFELGNCEVSGAKLVTGVSVSSGEITVNFAVKSIGLDYPF